MIDWLRDLWVWVFGVRTVIVCVPLEMAEAAKQKLGRDLHAAIDRNVIVINANHIHDL